MLGLCTPLPVHQFCLSREKPWTLTDFSELRWEGIIINWHPLTHPSPYGGPNWVVPPGCTEEHGHPSSGVWGAGPPGLGSVLQLGWDLRVCGQLSGWYGQEAREPMGSAQQQLRTLGQERPEQSTPGIPSVLLPPVPHGHPWQEVPFRGLLTDHLSHLHPQVLLSLFKCRVPRTQDSPTQGCVQD